MSTASNHSIYAQWTANTYTVTFVYGNGSANTTTTVTYDSAYGTLPEPSRAGYNSLYLFGAEDGDNGAPFRDIVVYRKNSGRNNYCRQHSYDYDGEENSLCGKEEWKNEYFTIKRFLFIQMFEEKKEEKCIIN